MFVIDHTLCLYNYSYVHFTGKLIVSIINKSYCIMLVYLYFEVITGDY